MSAISIVIIFFIATLLLMLTAYMWYVTVKSSPKYHLKRRLRNLAMDATDRRFPKELRVEIFKEMTPLDRFIYSFKTARRLDRLIDRAGLKLDTKFALLIMAILSFVLYVFAVAVNIGLVVSLIFIPVGVGIPLFYFKLAKKKQLVKFQDQFPDALDMIARSLQAGHSLVAAFHLVGTELPEPVSGFFRNAHEEQALGLSMREALEHMSNRIDSTDLRFFVMATNIHRDVGGNLGEILMRLAHTIRERIRIRRQVRVYTAQAKMTGTVLAVTPIFMALFLYLAMPGYIDELFTVEWGIYAIYFAVTAQILGFIAIRKIINIRI